MFGSPCWRVPPALLPANRPGPEMVMALAKSSFTGTAGATTRNDRGAEVEPRIPPAPM